jgi:hypothetical protein
MPTLIIDSIKKVGGEAVLLDDMMMILEKASSDKAFNVV